MTAARAMSAPMIPAYDIEIAFEGRSTAYALQMRFLERLRATATFIAQHAQKVAFGVVLGGITEVGHRRADNAVDAHSGPPSALAFAGIGHRAQDRDHAQFLQQGGIEGNLVQTVEDVACGTRRAQSLDRIIYSWHSRTFATSGIARVEPRIAPTRGARCGVPGQRGQQRTGLQACPTCRCMRTTPQRGTRPSRHTRLQPCACSIKLIVAAALIMTSAADWPSGAAAPVLATSASASTPLIANVKFSLAISILPSLLLPMAGRGTGTFHRPRAGRRPNDWRSLLRWSLKRLVLPTNKMQRKAHYTRLFKPKPTNIQPTPAKTRSMPRKIPRM